MLSIYQSSDSSHSGIKMLSPRNKISLLKIRHQEHVAHYYCLLSTRESAATYKIVSRARATPEEEKKLKIIKIRSQRINYRRAVRNFDIEHSDEKRGMVSRRSWVSLWRRTLDTRASWERSITLAFSPCLDIASVANRVLQSKWLFCRERGIWITEKRDCYVHISRLFCNRNNWQIDWRII